jgi:hypothetical protein
MAFQIRPDRAHDFSAPISSAFREFSIYSLPELAGPAVATHPLRLSSRLFTSPLGSLWGQRAPTQNSEEPAILTQNLHWELLRSREAALKELKSENVTNKALKRDHGMVEL